MKNFLNKNYIYMLIFLVFLTINFFVPIGGDDWEISSWYNKEGLFSLLCKSITAWSTFNGRIVHNFLTMFLGKYAIIFPFIMAAIYTLTIYYLLKIFKLEKNKKLQFLMLILFLMVPSQFRTEVQLHRNANIPYSIAALITFSTICFINKDKKESEHSKVIYCFMFVLGMIGSLLIENITIALLGTTLLIFIIHYVKTKKIDKKSLFVILGCILGCIILFSSPGFLNRYNSQTGSLSTIEIIKNNILPVLSSITLEAKSVYLLYGYFCLSSLFNKKSKNKNIVMKIYFIILNIILLSVIVLEGFNAHLLQPINIYYKLQSIFLSTDSIFCILLMISMLLSIPIMSIKLLDKDKRENALILYFLSLISMAPMVLAPGYRNYILCYYSLFIIIISIFSLINIEKFKRDNKIALLICFCVIFVFRLESYHYILVKAYSISKTRNEIIQEYKISQIENKGSEYLILPTYDVGIVGNLNSDYYQNSLINYYGLKKNTKVVFDDHFMYQGFELSKQNKNYKIKIIALSNEIKEYNVKIFNQESSELIYEKTQNNSEFIVKLEKGNYLLNCTMINSDNYLIKNENLNIK